MAAALEASTEPDPVLDWESSEFCHAINWLALSRLPAKSSDDTLADWLANTTIH
jgi:hypothetical protein